MLTECESQSRKVRTKDNMLASGDIRLVGFSLEQTFFILAVQCLEFTSSPHMYFETVLLDTGASPLTTMG